MFELFPEGYRNLIQNYTKPATSGLSAVLLDKDASNVTSVSNANMTYVRANTASPTQFKFTDLGYVTSSSTDYIYLTSSGLTIDSNDFQYNCNQYGHIIDEEQDLVYGYFRISETDKTFLNGGFTFTWSNDRISQYQLSESLSAGHSAFFDINRDYDLINNGRLAVVRNVGGISSYTFHDKVQTMNTMEDISTGNNIDGGNDTITMISSGHELSSFGIDYTNKCLSADPMVIDVNVPGTYDNANIMFYVENGAINDGGVNAIPFALFTDDTNITFTDKLFIQIPSSGIIKIS